MKTSKFVKYIATPVLICLFSASAAYAVATAGTACGTSGGDAFLEGFDFALHDDCASAANDFKLVGDTYQFTVSGDVGIQLSGTQTALMSFQNLSDGTDKQWAVSFGDEMFHTFEVSAGDYVLRVIGLRGSYDLALTAVPVPAAIWLLGSVLLGLCVVGRKRGLGAQTAVSA